MRLIWFVLSIFIVTLTACTGKMVDPPQVLITRYVVTATRQPSLTPADTPTVTPTPTNTPTATPSPSPTATAQAFRVQGNPRGYTLFDPQPQSSAPCGWVDTLDFPLAPPDGETAYGGGDFGVYRERYEKYHAGEDWGYANSPNFGMPVYSIGHGEVTYAAPNGWGADKGVVIIRHRTPGGRTFLSFYGHLDPPSVTLRVGQCITRNQKVGEIGRPRTPPHLHFEIRTHFPVSAGPGYWPSDPAQAGWLSPSNTITSYRLGVAPGIVWTNSTTSASSQWVGALSDETYLVLDGQYLLGLHALSGDLQWRFDLESTVKDFLLDADRGQLYLSESPNVLKAYAFPEQISEDLQLSLRWEQSLPVPSHSGIFPLPDGFILVTGPENAQAYGPDGRLLWTRDDIPPVAAWAYFKDVLIFTTTGENAALWSADLDGIYRWDGVLTGIPLAGRDHVWLYAPEGVYKLNLANHHAELIYPLPRGFQRRGDAIPLPDGGLIVAHQDSKDRRLLAFTPAGELAWEYSYRSQSDGGPNLFIWRDALYVMFEPAYANRGRYKTLEIFAVDISTGHLTRIFEGGSRGYNPRGTWFAPLDGHGVLVKIGGGDLLLFDPEAAAARMELSSGE